MERLLKFTPVLAAAALLLFAIHQRSTGKKSKEAKEHIEKSSRLLSFVPGPTSVPADVAAVYTQDFGSPDVDEDFFKLYQETQEVLQEVVDAPDSTVIIQSGEAMVSLWGSLKSLIVPERTKVLSIANGLYGYGFADMAKGLGAEVQVVGFEWDEIPSGPSAMEKIEKAAHDFRPHIITAVHCETPSGTLLTSIEEIGKISDSVNAIFYVDFVSSATGAPLSVKKCHIDLGLLGTQKALSTPPDSGIVFVSDRAWRQIDAVNYQGYDALLPFKEAVEKKYFPYTMNWRAVAAINLSCKKILREGLERVISRHAATAEHCRKRLAKMGIKLYPVSSAFSSPTCTAAYIPDKFTWQQFSSRLRRAGLIVGGSYGKLDGKIFRLGHMGSQATIEFADNCLDILQAVLQD